MEANRTVELFYNISTFVTYWYYIFYIGPWKKHFLSDLCWMGSTYRNFIQQTKLKPNEGYLLKKRIDIFVKIGHGITDMITGCTEFKFQHATNLHCTKNEVFH